MLGGVCERVRVCEAEESVCDVEEMDTSEPEWAWSYMAECGHWHLFGSDPFSGTSVSSRMIEENYQRNRQGYMEFRTPKHAYRIDFAGMRQINLSTGKQREVKRAVQTVSSYRSTCDSPAVSLPGHWEAVNSDESYQLVPLAQDSHEFREVHSLYSRTMSNPIRAILRIQNPDLWEFFCRKRAQLSRMRKGADVSERMLFHGTDAHNVPAICTFNFDWRIAGTHGCVYGKGSYFARDAKYSSRYCRIPQSSSPCYTKAFGSPCGPAAVERPYYCLFMARVLVGDYTLGSNTLVMPPSKDGTFANRFDSCVDDVPNPKIFVVFDSNHVYPEYLIHFYH
ncbi:protein mono-ADP-ribosyltransferase PARP11-like isoform X2 [Engraulis encrasicolus]